ncbi:MAG UNVERIFIED_CONTAM: Wzz/FepE/Etk N-terminal domain-containing protein [Anaerolineae bacterium]
MVAAQSPFDLVNRRNRRRRMNLAEYFRIILKRGWIIVLLVVIAAGVAYYLSARHIPVYRATQTVLILPSRADLGLAEATNRLLQSNVQYLGSTLRAQKLSTAYGWT